MKKVLFIMALIAGIFTASARDNYSHDASILPTAAQTEIKNNFKAAISHIKVEKDWGRVSEYDVVLTDGTEITYDKDGNWKDVEVRIGKSVPAAYVPDAIRAYVSQNQKKATIVGIERNRSGYEVELSNGVEMKFSAEGKFIKYSD